jgi:hypothetical protein
MKMKSIRMLLLGSVLLLVFSQIVFADTLATVGNYGPYQTGQGGEFTVSPDAGLSWLLNGYGTGAKDYVQTGTFQTFCLEHGEYLSGNTTYNVTLNDGAVYGGVGGAVNGKDPISIGTGWLYSQFASGTLANYDYTNHSTAGALQNTIWYLENEITDIPTNIFTTAVATQFGTLTNAQNDNLGAYNVMAANLWSGQPGIGASQDLLVASPVPEPASMFLMGSGLIGLAGWGRRKFFKKGLVVA